MSELDLKNDYDATHIYHPDLQREIQHWRRHLRITHYLDRPEECRDIVSVSGQILDQQLVNFGEQCKGICFALIYFNMKPFYCCCT